MTPLSMTCGQNRADQMSVPRLWKCSTRALSYRLEKKVGKHIKKLHGVRIVSLAIRAHGFLFLWISFDIPFYVDDFQNTDRIDEMLPLHFVVKNSTKKRLLRLNKIKYDAA